MRLTRLLNLLLVFAVALAAVHTGVGRAEARGAYSIVICSDGGMQTVTMGADGQPVTHLYTCPDCVLGGVALDGLPVRMQAPRLAARRMPRPRGIRALCSRRVPQAGARGPPVPV